MYKYRETRYFIIGSEEYKFYYKESLGKSKISYGVYFFLFLYDNLEYFGIFESTANNFKNYIKICNFNGVYSDVL